MQFVHEDPFALLMIHEDFLRISNGIFLIKINPFFKEATCLCNMLMSRCIYLKKVLLSRM